MKLMRGIGWGGGREAGQRIVVGWEGDMSKVKWGGGGENRWAEK